MLRTRMMKLGSRSMSTSGALGKHKFDEKSLLKYLAANLNKEEGINLNTSLKVSKFNHGQSNPTFLLTNEENKKNYVLRKQPNGELLKGAHAIDREFRIMTALKGHLPVPKTQLFCSDPSVIGTPFFVYDYVEGRFYKFPTLSSTHSSQERKAMYESICKTLAQLHSIDVKDVGLEDYGKGEGYLERNIKTWTRQYRASETDKIASMESLIDWLPQFINTSSYHNLATIVHGDFRVDNTIYHPVKNQIAAVLDWELSTLGNPLTDLAYLCLPYHLHTTTPMSGFIGANIREMGIPTQDEFIEMYVKEFNSKNAASSKTPLETAILQGVYKRSLMGNASADNATQLGTFAKDLSDIGWKLAMEYEKGLKRNSSSDNNEEISRGKDKVPPSMRGLLSDKAASLISRVDDFVTEKILPLEKEIMNWQYTSPDKWKGQHQFVEDLKREAKEKGLWNLFLPIETDPQQQYGAGLTNLEYATMCEIMGRSLVAPEVFNCSAPDTGNMEVLFRYGNEEQKRKWLVPLSQGTMRSCFGMTEPDVASSDATNMQATVTEDGDHYVLNGKKWWTSGAMDPRCKIMIFMGVHVGEGKDSNTPKHLRHSMVLVPMEAKGIDVIRPLTIFGYDDAPHGHAEVHFDNVRIPKSNMLLGAGRGFEIAQGRLGPGRIHHCMRLIGGAERALELLCERATSRVAFGKPLAEQGLVVNDIAESRVSIDQTRLLCLNAAHHMDIAGNKKAMADIAKIKIAAPRMAKHIIDRAMQIHGGAGLSQDFVLAHHYAWSRILQLADGPDETHIAALGKMELKNQQPHYKYRK